MPTLPQRRTEDRSVFPSPRDGASLGVTPDGFVWMPEPDAEAYELRVETEGGELVLRERVADHYHVPREPFEPGEYRWTVRAFNAADDPIGRREPWRFSVPDSATTVIPPTGREILDAVPDEHPKLVFPETDLPAVRSRVAKEQAGDLDRLESIVEDAYEAGLPDPPTFHGRETHAEQRQHYKEYFHHVRDHIDHDLRACALYSLLTGDEDAGAFAREVIRHVCGFSPDGPNSLEVQSDDLEWYWGDEPGLSYARILPQAYDWTHDRFTEREREFVERNLLRRCRSTFDRLRDSDFFTDPANSHVARLPAFLGEMAILLADRLDPGEAETMLGYVVDVFWTFYPHWGGSDGGWAEGVQYGNAYTTMWYPPFFATLERQMGISVWDRPFYRNVGDFFLYCAPPNAEDLPFGDAHEKPAGEGVKRALELYGAVTDDPMLARRADGIDTEEGGSEFHYHRFLYPPPAGDASARDRPDCRAFRDVGWAALHSDLANPDRDNYFAFRSSPYGNVSHSHNNQNAFAIASGGHSLAISSGYYPQYGFPHHAEWTRTTRAHNSVLVDGAGQERGIEATGDLGAFTNEPEYTYLRGEAATAYPDPVERFDRHVLFVDPGLYLVYDDLEAPGAGAYEWLLHSHESPEIDGAGDRVTVERGPARMTVDLFSDAGIEWSVTDAFDPPVNEGFEEEFARDLPDQHHATARVGGGDSRSILAVCRVGQPGTEAGPSMPAVDLERTDGGIRIEGNAFSGDVALSGDPSIRGTVRSGESTEQVDRP
ncbi:MAG: heparinase II/III family protein [Halobacteriales archaeon]